MTEAAARLLAEALRLSEEDRGDLAAKLLESLDPPEEPEDADAEAAWEEEIRRRLAEIDAGTAEMIPWSEARRLIMEDGDAASPP
jgi:putative addiction module component (TIGR02574 family)